MINITDLTKTLQKMQDTAPMKLKSQAFLELCTNNNYTTTISSLFSKQWVKKANPETMPIISNLQIYGSVIYTHNSKPEYYVIGPGWLKFASDSAVHVMNKYREAATKIGNQLCFEISDDFFVINFSKLFELSKDVRLEYIQSKIFEFQITKELIKLYGDDGIELMHFGCYVIGSKARQHYIQCDTDIASIVQPQSAAEISSHIIICYTFNNQTNENDDTTGFFLSSHLSLSSGSFLLNGLSSNKKSLNECLYFKQIQFVKTAKDITAWFGSAIRIENITNTKGPQYNLYWIVKIPQIKHDIQVDLLTKYSLAVNTREQVNWDHYQKHFKWIQKYSEMIEWMKKSRNVTVSMIYDHMTDRDNRENIVQFLTETQIEIPAHNKSTSK